MEDCVGQKSGTTGVLQNVNSDSKSDLLIVGLYIFIGIVGCDILVRRGFYKTEK